MRIFTYIALVARRIWAKRGMLFGSFLGATLVTALLVIVPLYESSIAAVDLLFTFRQAPAVAVDLRASASTTQYRGEEAAATSAAVNEAAAIVRPWYPRLQERTLGREIRFIPPGPPSSWFDRAEVWREEALAWREQVAALLDEATTMTDVAPEDLGSPQVFAEAIRRPETLPPDLAAAVDRVGDQIPELPDPPYPQPPLEATVSRFMTAPDLDEIVEIVAGELPTDRPDPASRAEPRLEVVLGEDVARLTGLGVGDTSILRPFVSLPGEFEVVEVAGIARAVDPTDPIWAAVEPGELIFLSQGMFDDWARPITPIVLEEDRWLRAERGFPGLDASVSWYLALDRDQVELENVAALTVAVEQFSAELGTVSGVAVSTALPDLIESFDVRSTVFGAPILAMLALIVAGALYFLIYTAALTLEREGPELAMLRTRGAGSWQTVGIHLAQSALIALTAALVAPFVARAMVAVTGLVPPMSELTGGEPLQVSGADSVLPFVVAGAVLTFASMGLAVMPIARRGILELRSMAARPPRQSFWQRYYIDIFVIVLAGVLLWELRRGGFVDIDEEGLDLFAIISPALFLVAGAFLLLRILPFVLRGIGWLMTRFQSMGWALPGWHLGRNPIPYGRLALLIWITTGFGAFALTYAQTLDASYNDRAAFATGSDARVVADQAGFLHVPEGAEAAAVLRTIGAPRLASRTAELLAVRPEEFSDVVIWRPDFGGATAEEVFSALRPDGRAPDWGVELSDEATALRVEALHLDLADIEDEDDVLPGREPMQLVVRVVDSNGRLWTFVSEPIPQDAWGTVEVALDPRQARNDGPAELSGPLAIQAMWMERVAPGGTPVLDRDQVLTADLRVVTAGGEEAIDEAVAAEFAELGGLSLRPVNGAFAAGVIADPLPGATRSGPAILWELPSRGQLGEVPHLARLPDPLAVILDPESAGIAQLDVGEDALFGIASQQIPGTRVGSVDLVPTATDPSAQGTMVVDLDGLMIWLNGTPTWSLTGNLSRLAEPAELWLKTDDPDGATRFVVAQLDEDPDLVVTAAGVATQFESRPVQVGLVAVLFVGAVTGVILALAGVTGYVLVAVRRRAAEMGVLRALGLGRRSVVGTFAVEQLVVLAVGAVFGVLAGVGLMRLVLPFLQLGDDATELVPSVELVLDPTVLGLYLLTVAGLLGLSVVWATRQVSSRRLSEVLREVDR